MALRVLVCGGRNFNDAMTFGAWLGGMHKNQGIDLIIHGGAPGADFMARKFAEWAGIPAREYRADWSKHGNAAGPIRNQKMLDDGKPDLVVAFKGGRGTADMIARAKSSGIKILEPSPIQ